MAALAPMPRASVTATVIHKVRARDSERTAIFKSCRNHIGILQISSGVQDFIQFKTCSGPYSVRFAKNRFTPLTLCDDHEGSWCSGLGACSASPFILPQSLKHSDGIARGKSSLIGIKIDEIKINDIKR